MVFQRPLPFFIDGFLREETLSERLYFWEILINSRNLFPNIFFHNDRFTSETYFLTIKRFWKAAHQLSALLHLSGTFITTAAAFRNLFNQ
jgi:hypothetical protein